MRGLEIIEYPPRRDQIRHPQIPCDFCPAKCCQYITLDLAAPKDWDDIDKMSWIVAHEGVMVYIDEGSWYVQVTTRCRFLTDGMRCGAYDARPAVCRDYSHADCEYEGFSPDREFHAPQEILDYGVGTLGPRPNPPTP